MPSILSITLLVLATSGTALAQSPSSASPSPARQAAAGAAVPGAQPGTRPLPSVASPAPAAPNDPVAPAVLPGDLSENTGLGLSLGGTVAAWALVLGGAANLNQHEGVAIASVVIGEIGTLVGPAFGHWYAHDPMSRGFGLRITALTVGAIGAGLAKCGPFSHCSDPGRALLGVVVAAYIGGTIDDIATAPAAVHRYNQSIRDVAIVPMVRGDTRSTGVMLTGRF